MLRGGAGIAFNLLNLLTRKRPRPLSAADGATLSDSAHEVVSEDGFSRLAHRPLLYLFLLFSLPFPSKRRGREGTNRFHGSSHFPPLPRPKGRTEGSALASVADRATARLFSVGDGVQLKRHCRLYPLKDIHLFARAQVGEWTASPDRKCNVERISFQKEGGWHNCTSARCT